MRSIGVYLNENGLLLTAYRQYEGHQFSPKDVLDDLKGMVSNIFLPEASLHAPILLALYATQSLQF